MFVTELNIDLTDIMYDYCVSNSSKRRTVVVKENWNFALFDNLSDKIISCLFVNTDF